MGVVYVGLFEMGITCAIWLKALKSPGRAAQVSNFIYLVPFLSLTEIHFIAGEKILLSTMVGLIFIISGTMLEQYDSRRKMLQRRQD